MAAWSAQIGSISVTITRAPWPRSDSAQPLPTSPKPQTTSDLAAEHHVGGPDDAVDERVAAAVEVVELRLGHRVVDVDRREQELAGFHHLIQAMDTGGGLLRHPADAGRNLGQVLGVVGEDLTTAFEEHTPLVGVAFVGNRDRPCVLELEPLVHEHGGVAAVVEDEVGATSRQASGTAARSHHQYSSSVSPFQAKTGVPLGASRVPVGPTATAAAAWSCVEKMLQLTQRTSAPSGYERLDEHRGLHGHVQRASDSGAGKRLLIGVLPRSAMRPGISCSARRISLRPKLASSISAILKSPVVRATDAPFVGDDQVNGGPGSADTISEQPAAHQCTASTGRDRAKEPLRRRRSRGLPCR